MNFFPCMCMTEAGHRCKNKAQMNSKYCYVHRKCKRKSPTMRFGGYKRIPYTFIPPQLPLRSSTTLEVPQSTSLSNVPTPSRSRTLSSPLSLADLAPELSLTRQQREMAVDNLRQAISGKSLQETQGLLRNLTSTVTNVAEDTVYRVGGVVEFSLLFLQASILTFLLANPRFFLQYSRRSPYPKGFRKL